MAVCPVFVVYVYLSCRGFSCELVQPFTSLWLSAGTSVQKLLQSLDMEVSLFGAQLYFGWLAFQLLLYLALPGPKAFSQITPAGNLLEYRVNGLRAWVVTHVLFVLGAFYFNVFSPTIIYDNWGRLLIWANVYGFGLATFAFLKAHLRPSHPEDCKFSGNVFYDFFMGIELNPRFGSFDFKLFHNDRIGIVAWTLVNLSFAAKQYEKLGYLTNSMVILNILQAVYVLDLFWNESWYLRTIDMAHDHFGFYFSWGDAVWLPYMYTLQGFYLATHAVHLPALWASAILCFGLLGYYIFRSANWQKDKFREARGNIEFWGKKATYIIASYTTSDGKEHRSLLLTSGWWGFSRHANYLGDIMLSTAMCLTCGKSGIIPYFYALYMVGLLVGRVYRDDSRCSGKYGKYWVDYCKKVPYKILPGIF